MSKKALVLIPCCKEKGVKEADVYKNPLPGLISLREQLLYEFGLTAELVGREENKVGILNETGVVTRAVDLYRGNFYRVAGESLKDLADDQGGQVTILIVSALYGLVQLDEGIRIYNLKMADRLSNGLPINRYWQKAGLWKVLLNYITNNEIGYVWSLLPNSAPMFPYHQVFKELWGNNTEFNIKCFYVRAPGAGTGTGYKRAKWLVEALKTDLGLLQKPEIISSYLSRIGDQQFIYSDC